MSSTASPRRVLIVEEELATFNGHWFQYIQDMATGFRELGDEVTILGPKTASARVIEDTGCLPLLPPSARGRHHATRNIVSNLGSIAFHNFRLSNAIRNFIRRSGTNWDLVVAPTNLVDHVLGHLATIKLLPKQVRHFLCIFPDLPGGMSEDYKEFVFPRSAKLLRKFLRAWRKTIKQNRGKLAVESQKMKSQYEALCSVPFELVPHVVHLPPTVERQLNRPFTIGCFGSARYDKGLDVLDRALELFLNRSPQTDVRFVVQWSKAYHLPDGSLQQPSNVLRHSPAVQLIETDFGSEAYFEHLCEVDAMVLPYRKFFYFTKLSRVAIDSAIAGKPFIYPAETWMEDFAKGMGAGLPFEADNPVSLADAIERMVFTWHDLRQLALTRMDLARAEHSPLAFARTAWGLFDNEPQVRG